MIFLTKKTRENRDCVNSLYSISGCSVPRKIARYHSFLGSFLIHDKDPLERVRLFLRKMKQREVALVDDLPRNMKAGIISGLELSTHFYLAQLIQGESDPTSLQNISYVDSGTLTLICLYGIIAISTFKGGNKLILSDALWEKLETAMETLSSDSIKDLTELYRTFLRVDFSLSKSNS